jgi:hypothetical protein
MHLSFAQLLMYLSNTTSPDITYVVSKLARYMAKPTMASLLAAKRVLRYLKGTTDLGLTFNVKNGLRTATITADADYAGDPETKRSTTGFSFHIHGGTISWKCKLQPTVALSSMKAEYSEEAVWLQTLLTEITGKPGSNHNL